MVPTPSDEHCPARPSRVCTVLSGSAIRTPCGRPDAAGGATAQDVRGAASADGVESAATPPARQPSLRDSRARRRPGAPTTAGDVTELPHRPGQPHRPGVRRPDHRRHHQGRRPRARSRPTTTQPGLAVYDPGFVNTASCRSSVTYIDGDKGILEYRGYPIEQLAEKSNFLEVAYLLIHGELPTKARVRRLGARDHLPHVRARERQDFMQGFRYDAHPMGMLMASVGALSTFYPDAAQHLRRRQPAHADRPDDREDADPRRLVVPARAGQAVRLPRQRPRLHRQLPLDAVQDERAEVRGRRAAGQGPRRAVHPARRPRAELLDQRGPLGRLLAGRPLLRGRRRRRARSTARCTAAPTRRCCGCCAGSARRRTSPPSSRA